MTEVTEVAAGVTPAVEEEQKQVVEQAEESQAKQPASKPVDHNWEQARQVLESQKRKIEELESRITQQAQPPRVEEKDEFADLDPQDYMTVEKYRAMSEKTIAKKAESIARQIVQEHMTQQNVVSDETRMRSKHDDYDYVIENFVLPEIKNNPALAHKIQHSRNPAETAYKLGKLSDEYEESMTKKDNGQKAEKILKNTQRPVSGNAVGTPLKTQADQFSSKSKEDVWKESQKYARGA